MKKYKVEVNVKPTKDGREIHVEVSVPPDHVKVGFFRRCPAGEVRQAILDTINIAFGEVLEV